MKKVMLIMAAALLMLTQCKKENETPNGPAEGTVKMTVTAGPGRTSIDPSNGAITWSADDKLYVSNGTNWLGSLTLASGAGSAQGTFTGSITGLDDEGTPCHFFYLGHDNGMTEPTAGTGTGAVISFAEQDGTLAGAMKYHIGYGTTDVTVKSGEYQGYVIMDTKIAIARIDFTMNGAPHTGAVTMGMYCADVSNTMTVSPDGTFSGSGNGGIVIGKGTTGEKYVTLIPTTETGVLNVSFTGYATGSMTFAKGIHKNKFYGMKNAIAVTLTPNPKFSVDENNTTVEFAPGNLWYNTSEEKFYFEANQWDFRHYSGIANDAAVIGGVSTDTPAGTVGSFYWSKTAQVAYAQSYSDNEASTDDVFFTNADVATANPDFTVNGETGKWRTLSKAEWDYLLGTGDARTSSRTNASSLRALKELDGHNGLVILPDGTGASIMNSITSTADLASHGAVFLPAAGFRYNGGGSGITVQYCNAHGHYWSSINDSFGSAYNMAFSFSGSSNAPSVDGQYRYSGSTVRLVR